MKRIKFVFTMVLTLAVTVTVLLSTSANAFPIAGSTSGVFQNPAGEAGAAPFYKGVGTSNFGWGDLNGFGTGANYTQFAGVSFSTSTETDFKLGTLTYFNGTTAVGTNATSVDLDVTLAFTTPTGINELFTFQLDIATTTNTTDPVASADILTLPTFFPPQTFAYNGVDYTVQLDGFSNVSINGFITGANNNEFHVYEDGTATADLTGKVTSNIPSASVPEPSTMLLLISSLFGLGWVGRRFTI